MERSVNGIRYDILLPVLRSAESGLKSIEAVAAAEYDKSKLNIVVVLNASGQECGFEKFRDVFGGFRVESMPMGSAFGSCCNFGAAKGSAPYIITLSEGAELSRNALSELDKFIECAGDDAAAFELWETPYETAKHPDPVTMEIQDVGGSCAVYSRKVFEELGGFDAKLSARCSLELSWRMRAAGYRLFYVPKAEVRFAGRNTAELQGAESAKELFADTLLRYKYGSLKRLLGGEKQYLSAMMHPALHSASRGELVKDYLRHIAKIPKLLMWRHKERELFLGAPAVFNYDESRVRGFYTRKELTSQPLVSVIVRASGNGPVLRETLKCLRHQRYGNFEIVLQEDGPNTVEEMVREEFFDLPISYEATGTRVGRSRAGNRAMERAKGELFCFLDSDDFYFPEHLEMLVLGFEQHPDADIVLSGSLQYNTDIISAKDTYLYERVSSEYRGTLGITLPGLCKEDPIPILTAMFRKELFLKKGGLREDIDTNEDWAMWLRYFTLAPSVYGNFRASCAYVFPNSLGARVEKLESYKANHHKVYEDPSLVFSLSVQQLKEYASDGGAPSLVKEIPMFY